MGTAFESQVRQVLKQEISRLKEGAVEPGDVPDDMLLFDVNEDGSENLGLDSLDALEIAMAVEQHFDVRIPEDIELKDLSTINSIVYFALRLSQEQGVHA